MALMNINSQEYTVPHISHQHRMKVQFGTHPKESRRINGNAGHHTELDHLEAIGKTFPNGCLFRFQIKADIFGIYNVSNYWECLQLNYASSSWEKISNIPFHDVMQNTKLLLGKIHPDDLEDLLPLLHQSLMDGVVFNTEIRYQYTNTDTRWYRISTQPRRDGDWVVCDSLLLDITKRKKDEIELALYRSALEPLIKERTGELETAKEELNSVKRELERKNIQLHNEILAHMKVVQQLENCKNSRRTSSNINGINKIK